MIHSAYQEKEKRVSLLGRLFSKLADIYLWNDASKACFVALGCASALMLFSLWYWAHYLSMISLGISYIPFSEHALINAAQYCFALAIFMFLVSVLATYCVLQDKYHKKILYLSLATLAFCNSIVFALLGVFDGVSWLYILIYTAIGLVFLHRVEVLFTISSMVLWMFLWSFTEQWLPFDVRAYQFTNEITVNSMSVWDLLANWFVILSALIFCSLMLDILMGAWHNREQDLHHKSYRDELTSLLNRRAIQDGLKEEFFRAKRGEYPLSVAMIDIDHFKRVNDRYGHPFGDKVLRLLAAKITEITRKKDLQGRYGGEEFLIVLPECEGDVANKILERLRENMETQVMHTLKGEEVTITLSAGIAELEKYDKIDDIIGRADKALYQAKNAGRNQVQHG